MTGGRGPGLTPSFVAARRPEVASVETDDGTVLFDERSDVLHVLSGTAAVVWDGYDGRRSVAELATDLAATYDADADTVRSQVLALTEDLVALSVVTESGTATPATGSATSGTDDASLPSEPDFVAVPPST